MPEGGLPDVFTLRRIASEPSRLPAEIVEARIGQHMFHPKFHQEPVPILGGPAAQNKIQRAVLGLIAIFGRVGVMVDMEAEPIVGITQCVPHDTAQMEQRAELIHGNALAWTVTLAMEERAENR